MKLYLLGLGLFAGVVNPSLADTLPRYDPPVYCKKVSDFGGRSSSIYKGCLEMEQDAYNELKSVWSSLNSKTQSYCNEVASFSDRLYSILKGCVNMENDASSSTPDFKF